LSPMLIRWYLTLQEYNFTIEHCPGIDNILPDVLSRQSELSTVKVIHTHDNRDDDSRNIGDRHTDRQVISDPNRQQELLRAAHQLGHFGPKTLVTAIRWQGHNWPTLRRDAEHL
ncbi:hypothetical protein EV182_007392, partial [Spiromyces aspiralis]